MKRGSAASILSGQMAATISPCAQGYGTHECPVCTDRRTRLPLPIAEQQISMTVWLAHKHRTLREKHLEGETEDLRRYRHPHFHPVLAAFVGARGKTSIQREDQNNIKSLMSFIKSSEFRSSSEVLARQ